MKYNIYLDESSKSHQFLTIGGLLIPQYREVEIITDIERIKAEFNKQSELHWNKLGRHYYSLYKTIIEYTFHLIDSNKAHFKAIIFNTNQIDYNQIENNDIDYTIRNMTYHLMNNQCVKPYYPFDNNIEFKLLYDCINDSKYPLPNYLDMFNNGIKKKSNLTKNHIESIEYVDSKKSKIIQLSDILIGGIGYYKNYIQKNKGEKNEKYNLSTIIIDKIGENNINFSSQIDNNKYSIWNFKYYK